MDNKDKYYRSRLNLHYTDISNDSDTNYNIYIGYNINTGSNTNSDDINTNTNDLISCDNYFDRKMWQTVKNYQLFIDFMEINIKNPFQRYIIYPWCKNIKFGLFLA